MKSALNLMRKLLFCCEFEFSKLFKDKFDNKNVFGWQLVLLERIQDFIHILYDGNQAEIGIFGVMAKLINLGVGLL